MKKITLVRLCILLVVTFAGPVMQEGVYAQSCNCTDYLYLNDEFAGITHKFMVGANGLTEVGSPWRDWPVQPVDLNPPDGNPDRARPHGLTTDVNGNLYIAGTEFGPTYKLNCEGEVIYDSPTDSTFSSGGGFNFITIGNYLYTSNFSQDINIYEICGGSPGALTGTIELTGSGGDFLQWGLSIGENGSIYATTTGSIDGSVGGNVYIFDPSEIDPTALADPVNNINVQDPDFQLSATFLEGILGPNPTSGTGHHLYGVDADADGNLYLMIQGGAQPDGSNNSAVLKTDAAGNILDQAVFTNDPSAPLMSPGRGRGLVYDPATGYVFVGGGSDFAGSGSFSENTDCLSAFTASTLDYDPSFSIPHVTGQAPKGVALATECCPDLPSAVINAAVCGAAPNERIFLQEFIGCDGPICSSVFTPAAGNTGITFDPCDNSIQITDPGTACGSFTITSNSSSCSNLSITLNLDFATPVVANVSGGGQTVCPGADGAVLTANGSGINGYQWQRSITNPTEGFADISGATSATYTPTAVVQTTYYRVVTTVDGSCTGSSDICETASPAVTITASTAACPPPTYEIIDPCTCFNVEYDEPEIDPLEFLDSIKITAPAGQIWTIVSVTGIEQVDTLLNIPITPGLVIPEIDGMPGMYGLRFAHTSGIGYTVTVENNLGEQLSIQNRCTNPSISAPALIAEELCVLDATPIQITADATLRGLPAGGTFTFDIYNSDPFVLLAEDVTEINPSDYTDGQEIEVEGTYTPPPGATGTDLQGVDYDLCPHTFYYYITVSLDACACTDIQDGDDVGGVAFLDFDDNGAIDATEPNQPGVDVVIYDCDGNLVCETVTNTSGEWSCRDLDPTQTYRVEFSLGDELGFLEPGIIGADNGGDVQFVTPGNCDVNFGTVNKGLFCDATPSLGIPCYIVGDPDDPSGAPLDAFVQFPDTVGRDDMIPFHNASAQQVGSTWGTAYQKSTGRLFSGAMLKRHSGLGPGGIDAIYAIDANSNNAGTIWLDGVLDTDVSAAINPASPLTAVPTNAERGLGGATDPSHDEEVFPLIGKVGFGDVDISEDDQTLYIINLADRTLNLIDIASVDAGSPQIETFAIPEAVCTDGISRPWGMGVLNGRVYVGVTCTGELSNYWNGPGSIDPTTNLEFFIFVFTPGEGFSNIPVVNFSLDYDGIDGNNDKGCSGATVAGCRWFTWKDEWIDENFNPSAGDPSGGYYHNAFNNPTPVYIAPTPILSDIDFDSEDYMVINLMDRTGHQLGWINYKPDPADNSLIRSVSGGDLLLAAPNPTSTFWTLEAQGVAGDRTSGGTGTAVNGPGGPNAPQGPAGGEFFWEDFIGGEHSETGLGSSAIVPGSTTLRAAVMDAEGFRTNGVKWFDMETGSIELLNGEERAFDVYFGQDDANPAPTFGKANGLGDLTLICDPVPIQIGNYVWIDEDEDGVQDPCEPPLANVSVSLYGLDENGLPVLLATTQTDANGNYLFQGDQLDAATWVVSDTIDTAGEYLVVFGENNDFDAVEETIVVDGVVYIRTINDTGEGNGPNQNDSDITTQLVDGNQALAYFIDPAETDQTNLTFDAGFTVVCPYLELADETPSFCGTDSLDLATVIDSVFAPEVYEYSWSTSGDGNFVATDGTTTLSYAQAASYLPGPEDRRRGSVVLTLSSDTATLPDGCEPVSEEVTITVLNVDCGSFPWGGN